MQRIPAVATVREPSMGVARSLNFNTPATTRRPPQKPRQPDATKAGAENATKANQPSDKMMQVYLRIRPFSNEEKSRDAATSIVESKNPSILLMTPREPMKHPPAIRRAGYAKFRFSHVFQPDSTQEQVFESTALPLIDGLFSGQSAVVFAYGVTCSGKTWTIQGSPEAPGILPRALDVIINSIAKAKGTGLAQDKNVSEHVAELTEGHDMNSRLRQRHRGGDRSKQAEQHVHDANYVEAKPDVNYKIYASYLEVYNELCYDLFDSTGNGSAADRIQDATGSSETKDEPFVLTETESSTTFVANTDAAADLVPRRRRVLRLKDAHGDVYAEGRTEVEIKSAVDVERLLEFGQQNRSVAATNSNERSSRSHAIFIITLKQTESLPQQQQKRGAFGTTTRATKETISRLHIVDLAGSEKTSKVSSTANRSKESRNINTSLMTLSRCLEGLRYNSRQRDAGSKKAPHIVPFRDSKLTWLLQHPLSSGASVMVATAAPTIDDADETIHTLRSTAVAREVKTDMRAIRRPLVDLSNHSKRTDGGATVGCKAPTRTIRTRGGLTAQSTRAHDSSRDGRAGRACEQERLNHQRQRKTAELERKVAQLEEENKNLRLELQEARENEKKQAKALEKADDEYAASQEELDGVFRENDSLRDMLAEATIRVKKIEIDIREDAVKQVDFISKEMETRYEAQIAKLSEQLKEKEPPSVAALMTQTERRLTTERLARRLTRHSCAALQVVRHALREPGENSDSSDRDEGEEEDSTGYVQSRRADSEENEYLQEDNDVYDDYEDGDETEY